MGRGKGERVQENTSGWAARYGDLAITQNLGVNPGNEEDLLAAGLPLPALLWLMCVQLTWWGRSPSPTGQRRKLEPGVFPNEVDPHCSLVFTLCVL